nr:venom protease-like [Onthophagus taurus]
MKFKGGNYFNIVLVLLNFLQLSLTDDATLASRTLRQTAFCPSNSQCVPISSCPILRDVLNSECVISSRIGKLGCGFQGSGLVCCPSYDDSNNNIAQDRRDKANTKCGQSSIQGEYNYDGIGAYPFVARVGFRNSINGEIKYPCTGSIISNRVILTAAHCALAKATNFKLYSVRVGEYLTNTDIDCGEEFCGLPAKDVGISHVVVHPGYQKDTYQHNIALLVLRQNLNYTVTTQPICLPETWLEPTNNNVLVGWGKAAGQRDTPPRQQSIRVPIVNLQQCKNVYGNTLPISDDQLCAGGDAGKDACSGFGGAPLLTRSGDSHYQVGILSFGSDQCGAPGVPSVYVDVRKYSQWIKENIPLSYN